MPTGYLFTSESVSEGHPDKVADQISDAVLDAMISQDKRSRVACETLVKTGVAIVAGEVTTSAYVEIPKLNDAQNRAVNEILAAGDVAVVHGPPGTGKTLLAEAVAGETGKPYVFVDPGAFINMFFGVGVLKVKSLYRKLRKLSLRYGGVIVFFDEADTLGSRGGAVSQARRAAHAAQCRK